MGPVVELLFPGGLFVLDLRRALGLGGVAGQGAAGRVFWVIDQLDSLAGMLLFIAPVWRPSAGLLAQIVAIMLVAHPVSAWVMVQFGLKDRVG